jgi:hypothetical protein
MYALDGYMSFPVPLAESASQNQAQVGLLMHVWDKPTVGSVQGWRQSRNSNVMRAFRWIGAGMLSGKEPVVLK